MTTIANPTETIARNFLPWSEYEKHIRAVVGSYPAEYTIFAENASAEHITVFNKPITPAGKAIIKDQLIHIEYAANELRLTITNEDGAIASYNELERDKASLAVFIKLMNLSIDHKLTGIVSRQKQAIQDEKKAIQNQASTKLLFSVITMIAAAVLVVFGMNGCMH